MAIRFLENNAIDFDKWDAALDIDPSGLPYAYSWYLNCFAQNKWTGLVEGDYEKVMPLPWNAKLFGVKQIFRPPISQQLGVFGPAISLSDRIDFLKAIPNQYQYVLYALYTEGQTMDERNFLGHLKARTNLLLDLRQSHDSIFSKYSKSLKKRIKKARSSQTLKASEDLDTLIQLYQKELADKVKLNPQTYLQIKALFRELLNRKMGIILESYSPAGKLIASCFFIITPHRIINVFGASNVVGKALHAMHFILDHVIQKYAGQKKYFDFEGSDVPGVAAFFRSFGAQQELYYQYKRDTLPSLLSRIRERRFI